MLTVKEAIERRRSIRRYRPDPIPEESIRQILEAARLAPSGSNRQPWRFIVVTDAEERKRLRVLASGQEFIEEAPVIFICCADLNAYTKEARQRRLQEYIESGLLAEFGVSEDYLRTRISQVAELPMQERYEHARFNVAIAVQNMVLMTTALGLGSCWVGAMDGQSIHDMYQLHDNIRVIVLLAVGYPAQQPAPRPRIAFEEMVLKPEARVET